VGAFYAARTERWALAGALAAGASATRLAGVALVVPLALLYLYGPRGCVATTPRAQSLRGRLRPRYPIRADIAWIALAPGGLALYSLFLGVAYEEPFAYLRLQDLWGREFTGPLAGAWRGLREGVEGARELLTGSPHNGVFAGGRLALQNLMLLGFLGFGVVATVGAFRRLPIAYGAYAAVALMLPLSSPGAQQPLMSMPRFLAVLFPLYMWLALACHDRRRALPVMGASSALLVFFTAQVADWRWIA
jgi:hypothetical protein